jgi:hypothetical protein
LSPQLQGVVVGGLLSLVVSMVTLIVARWLRRRGKVRCEIDWRPVRSAGSVDSPGGVEVHERHLKVMFLNGKDVPVTVWDMRVVFYKGDKPLDERECPDMQFTDPNGVMGVKPLDLVNLPPHVPVTPTISVYPHRNAAVPQQLASDRERAVKEADRIEFVAIIDGARDIRTELAPWNDPTPQTKRLPERPW